jgi:hypothetical protein
MTGQVKAPAVAALTISTPKRAPRRFVFHDFVGDGMKAASWRAWGMFSFLKCRRGKQLRNLAEMSNRNAKTQEGETGQFAEILLYIMITNDTTIN